MSKEQLIDTYTDAKNWWDGLTPMMRSMYFIKHLDKPFQSSDVTMGQITDIYNKEMNGKKDKVAQALSWWNNLDARLKIQIYHTTFAYPLSLPIANLEVLQMYQRNKVLTKETQQPEHLK